MEPASPIALLTRFRMIGLIVLGTLALISASVAVVAAATTGPSKQTATRDTGNVQPSPSATVSPSPTASAPTTGGGDQTGYNGGQSGGPHIDYFRVTNEPECLPGGRSTLVSVEWGVSGGATGATMSVDNAGTYRTYPGASGTDSLPFPCEHAKPGSTVKHTYTLRTTGGGQPNSKTLTLTAKSGDPAPTPSGHKTNPPATPSAPARYNNG
jgi:hypothetical protein